MKLKPVAGSDHRLPFGSALIPAPFDVGFRGEPGAAAITFKGCFGWLHAPPPVMAGDVGVVLCTGFKSDAMNCHRSYRNLADQLAEAGYPTLRFDYPGAGDSSDVDAIDHDAVWLGSIQAAIDQLRTRAGIRRIVLCGVKFGATLAALVASLRGDVAGLVLLAPVLRGRSFLQQLCLEAGVKVPDAASQGSVSSHELTLSFRTVQWLKTLDLSQVEFPPGLKITVFSQPTARLTDCVTAWRGRGIEVACEDFAGLEPMLRPSYMSHEDPADIAMLVAHITASCPPDRRLDALTTLHGKAELRTPGAMEQPFRFGAGNGLFGILCRPERADRHGPVVIILNSSGDPRYGFARSSTGLARRLAERGVASLRFDFAGIGDSDALGAARTHIFETDRRPDIRDATDALLAAGYRQVALYGLCSGAYHALQAAIADTRFSAVLLVNLPMLEWRDGDRVELLLLPLRGTKDFLARLRRRILSGTAVFRDLRPRARVTAQMNRIAGASRTVIRTALSRLGLRPLPPDPADRLLELSKRTPLQLLYCGGDPGLSVVATALQRKRGAACVGMAIDHDLDHSLSRGPMHAHVAGKLIALMDLDRPKH